MKLKLSIVFCFFSHVVAQETPTLLIPITENWEYSESDFHMIALNDFDILKDKVGALCKKPVKSISSELKEAKILRVQSEGEVKKIDCETIELQLRAECRKAAEIVQSISVSNSLLTSTIAHDTYNDARQRFKNAFHLLIISFGLRCYNSLEKLYQVLSAFSEAETAAKRRLVNRDLDDESKTLYYQLLDIVEQEKIRRDATTQLLIPIDNTKMLINALADSGAQKSFHDGATHFDAARSLLRSIKHPTIEGINSIEIFFFIAFEHFLTSFNRGDEKGLIEAGKVVGELKKLDEMKHNQHNQNSKRYELAKTKLEQAQQLSIEHLRSNSLDQHDSSGVSQLERHLREDATQTHPPSSTENTQAEKSFSEKQPGNTSSERAVRKSHKSASLATLADLNQALPPSITPLSLLKAVASAPAAGCSWIYKNCKKLWKKL